MRLELRRPLRRFAGEMERVLRENDNKGGWQNEQLEGLGLAVIEEFGEFQKAMRKGDRMGACKELVDAANFLMMLHDRLWTCPGCDDATEAAMGMYVRSPRRHVEACHQYRKPPEMPAASTATGYRDGL